VVSAMGDMNPLLAIIIITSTVVLIIGLVMVMQ
jgi:hypothetical protein